MALLNMKKDFLLTFVLLGIVALAIPTHVMSQSGVADIVTAAFFDGIKNQAAADCSGKSFYTRDAFINAANSFPQFGSGSADEAKREIAAFFAHVTHETGHLCYVEELTNQTITVIKETHTGQAIGFDGLNSPETVANDPVISFKTALWFWMTNVHSVVNQGFGATIQKINGALECNGKQPALVQARIGYYTDYCQKFGVSPGENLSC
ncbi:hypothetical protein ACOSQ3_006381 [Xanthoceras sorbifolium]